jgi:hypothetical protein
MSKQTTQTKLFQLPINPGEELKAKEVKSKIGAYKALHDNRSLIEALAEMLDIVEKAEGK